MDGEPCGRCDGGIYAPEAVLGAMPYVAKEKPVPNCKTRLGLCVGIQHCLESFKTVQSAVDYLRM